MSKTVYIPEILAMIDKASKKQEKIDILHRFQDVRGFKEVLFFCYEPYVKFHFTVDDLDNLQYDKMDIPDYDTAPTNLFLEAPRKMRNYTNLRKPFLSKEKCLRNIASDFSAMHHEEVEIYKQIVGKKLKARGLTENLVGEVFPDIFYTEELREKYRKFDEANGYAII